MSEGKKELSLIVPFVNEHPQIYFTLRALAEELKGEVDFEILAVDNFCPEAEKQGPADRSHQLVESLSANLPWLRVLHYTEKLSHWNAKRIAVEQASSDIFFFVDAHCMLARGVPVKMFHCYRQHWKELDGSIHLPLTYHILEEKRLIYSLNWISEKSEAHYTFMAHPMLGRPLLEVPVMSTCGMMIHRSLYDLIGGWPRELGVYGGGENFLNFTLAALGKKKYVFGEDPCYHHGSKRGYQWNFQDYERNRLIATYLFGGEAMAAQFLDKRDKIQNKRAFWRIFTEILEKCHEQRAWIEQHQVMEIQEWAETWRGTNWK